RELPVAARAAHLNAKLPLGGSLPEPAGLVDDDGLGAGDEVDDRTRHGGDVCQGGLAGAPGRLGAHGRSPVSTSVAWAAWKPPCPATTHTSASGTWRSAHSPRTCRTPSAICPHPVRSPSLSMPPDVFDGSSPPSFRPPSWAKGPPSPFLQYP